MRGRGWRWILGVIALVAGGAPAGPALTALERTWIEAAVPVLVYGRTQGLPLDIVVQPQPTPGETPLGLAFVDGRCKFVLSMRGNPAAQAALDSMPPGLVEPIVESLAAHELAHCRRHVQRDWGRLPAGLREVPVGDAAPSEHAAALAAIGSARREEAYADLVGLAWTLQYHRAHFTAVHAWYLRLRAASAFDLGPHDTGLWVQLAADPAQFPHAASVFERAEPLWTAGLLADR